MSGKLEVSFNSPQCGWMSIGFDDGVSEFHTTTAYTPYPLALNDILKGLTSLLDLARPKDKFLILWSRNPEMYDFCFERTGEIVRFKIIEYPTVGRAENEAETVFSHEGNVHAFCRAFYKTFVQLYEEKSTDEFEFNWRQPFPFREYEEFRSKITTK
ncbi:MAG: hypothetical protein ABJB40_03370 [Acidobacteriota bacterium]